MYYSIICRPELHQQVKDIISGNIHFESTTDAKESLDAAARVNSAVLIIDVDIGNAGEIITGIKKYRVARPETRIILLAPGREPGDQLIAALISKGVYDIIAPMPEEGELNITVELQQILQSKPGTYADVVRWDLGVEEAEEKERIIFQERLIGMGVIVVCGAGNGAGSTTMAIAISQYLAGLRKKVVLAERCRYPVLWAIKDRLHSNVKAMPGSSYFAHNAKIDSAPICPGDADYMIVDLGNLYEPNPEEIRKPNEGVLKLHPCFHEIYRASMVIVCCGTQPWHVLNMQPLYNIPELEDMLERGAIVVTPNRRAAVDLKRYSRAVQAPYFQDPFKSGDEAKIFFDELLEPVLPSEKPGLLARLRSRI